VDQKSGGGQPVIVVGELARMLFAIDKVGDEIFESFEHILILVRRAIYRGICGRVQACGKAAKRPSQNRPLA
jgi:hypothetical protein